VSAPERETRPSIAGLWDTLGAVKSMKHLMHYDQQPYWRISEADWEWLCSVKSASWSREVFDGFEVASLGGERVRTLFGVPVRLVRPGRFGSPPQWPELVIVCDRRN
jgi:hypothetical protein